jgi:hypothetical protein
MDKNMKPTELTSLATDDGGNHKSPAAPASPGFFTQANGFFEASKAIGNTASLKVCLNRIYREYKDSINSAFY